MKITYIRMRRRFIYLLAIMDWYSRFVLLWEILSVALDVDFCMRVLETALIHGNPEIFNSDHGTQFTSESFTLALEDRGIRISMDGRGRVYDNIFIERLWRIVKYEEGYLKDYRFMHEACEGLDRYFKLYNHNRLHQPLSTPASFYFGKRKVVMSSLSRDMDRSYRDKKGTKSAGRGENAKSDHFRKKSDCQESKRKMVKASVSKY